MQRFGFTLSLFCLLGFTVEVLADPSTSFVRARGVPAAQLIVTTTAEERVAESKGEVPVTSTEKRQNEASQRASIELFNCTTAHVSSAAPAVVRIVNDPSYSRTEPLLAWQARSLVLAPPKRPPIA